MSFDDLHSTLASNDRPATEAVSSVDIEFDVRLLGSLMAESEEIPVDDSEFSELLARLDNAATMASGVEARLEEILGTLDDLLTNMELNDSDKPQEVTIPCSESQSEHLPSEQP